MIERLPSLEPNAELTDGVFEAKPVQGLLAVAIHFLVVTDEVWQVD